MRAALELLGEGPPALASFGLTQVAIAERLGISSGTVSYHFGRGSPRELAPELTRRLHQEIVDEAGRNAEAYRSAARDLEAGARIAGRALVRRVLIEDLADYRVDAESNLLMRARERLYYLMLALCDLDRERCPVDCATQLRETMLASQDGYAAVYDDFCAASHREYIAGRDRTQRAINAYLEGVSVHRRFGEGPDDDAIVDDVLRLFYITTKPVGGADLDIDGDLFGLPSMPESGSVGTHSTVHATREALYLEVANAMEALAAEEVLLHCATHRPLHEDRPPADPLSRRLYDAQHAHIAHGGAVRRIVRYWRLEDLDADLRWLAAVADRGAGALIETRALIADSPPVLATMVVGERFGSIAREDPLTARLVDGVTFTDRAGVRFCEAAFDGIANDPHSYLIASPNGVHPRGAEDARRRLIEHSERAEIA